MCGRLDIVSHPLIDLVSEQFGFEFHAQTNRDLRPTQQVEVIGSVNELPQQVTTHWGIQPDWAKRILINAQSESVMTKPTFKSAFALHRCVVPCSGWYEWKMEEGCSKKTKYLFSHAKDQPLYMAGIYYPMAEDDVRLVTLTTAPTEQCEFYHKRMPLLIRPAELKFWLTSEASGTQPLLEAPADLPLTIRAV